MNVGSFVFLEVMEVLVEAVYQTYPPVNVGSLVFLKFFEALVEAVKKTYPQ